MGFESALRGQKELTVSCSLNMNRTKKELYPATKSRSARFAVNPRCFFGAPSKPKSKKDPHLPASHETPGPRHARHAPWETGVPISLP